jgi:uncharacterized protein (TIGR01370 family)
VKVFALASCLALCAGAETPFRWVCYYSDKLPAEAFLPYDLAVFDNQYHPPLAPLLAAGKQVYGYISLGEVEKRQTYFEAVRAEGILVGENENWKDSFFVDLRDPRWRRRVLRELIPAIRKQGFPGIFIDTIDDAQHLETADPRKFKGMQAAAGELILAIRKEFPDVGIILNRGFFLLPEVAGSLDYVLGESIYSDFDFASKQYRKTPEREYREAVATLQEARRAAPRLQVLTLDYWWPSDQKRISRIYAVERAKGFLPYVATVGLDTLVREPGFRP